MMTHIRAHILLVSLTLVICGVLYPLTLLAFGQVLFPTTANGSLVLTDGKPQGSSLIAQDSPGDLWFVPRPSAAGYNGAASSGSNWGANNPKLRDRAARILGPIVKYRTGSQSKSVQEDIDAWFIAKPDRFLTWAKTYPTLSAVWMSDTANTTAVSAWIASTPGKGDFFEQFTIKHPGTFPIVEGTSIVPTTSGSVIHATFFDMWLQDNPMKARDIEPVPADVVTASGSGLDPHITLRNANFQLERVADAWSKKTSKPADAIVKEITTVLKEQTFTPLLGLADSEPMVNVLEVNRAMGERLVR